MRIVLLFLVIFGCVQKKEYAIGDVDLSPAHYINLLRDVNNQLQRADEEIKTDLLYRKLFISQQLRWPEDVSAEINFLIETDGLNYEIYAYAKDFYQSSHYYEKLLNLVNKWLDQHQATTSDLKAQIVALTGLNRENEAKYRLWDLLQSAEDLGSLSFIAQQYLDFKDTARALYAYATLAQYFPQEEVLQDRYIPLLLKEGYAERARDLLLSQAKGSQNKRTMDLMAEVLFEMGEPYQAIGILRRQKDPNDYLKIAHWYQSVNAYDSALYFTDLKIEIDSTQEALITKGKIYEQRGWLNSAYTTFQAAAQRNPSDSIANAYAENVARKIAYLRRKREAEESIPMLEPIKKSTDNE